MTRLLIYLVVPPIELTYLIIVAWWTMWEAINFNEEIAGRRERYARREQKKKWRGRRK